MVTHSPVRNVCVQVVPGMSLVPGFPVHPGYRLLFALLDHVAVTFIHFLRSFLLAAVPFILLYNGESVLSHVSHASHLSRKTIS